MREDNPMIVEPVTVQGVERWRPSVGSETLGFLNAVVPESSQESVRDAAVSILSKSVPPNAEDGRETGLVVGYIQSGKTMSIEMVTALARDNGFQIVVVVAGIANLLLDQSTRRLRNDLRLDDPDRPRNWILFSNPSAADVARIRDVLDAWPDPDTPEEYKNTIMITVLKHHQHLRNLTDLIRSLDVERVPVLIIDDEADQASLNTGVSQHHASTTYRRLVDFRKSLSNHTYLQYTATPQAPLLVSIIDSLSPNFVQVLEPGDAYVGGREFFADNRYVRIIPPQDVPTNTNSLTEPPDSLLEALCVFIVGVAVGIKQSRNTGNRSMLVHPSHRTAQHQEYYNWVFRILENWKIILGLPKDDPDKQELLGEFRVAYEDLRRTVESPLTSFDDLVPHLSLACRNTRVLEVNAREGVTPLVDWRNVYGWILVGGQAMDRGFTVEGLTVTYMPRGIGVGNADTVQQRARFFGYKRPYLGFCRVYLEQGTLHAFQTYVEHEEDIRSQLKEFQESGRPLNDWKRAFVLDANLRPCRRSVLEFDYMSGRFSATWVVPRVIYASDDIAQANRRSAAEFLHGLEFREDDGHPDRTPFQRHLVCRDTPLRTAIEKLLVRIKITGMTDSQRNIGLLLQLAKVLEKNPDEGCTIYRISPFKGRRRSINEDGEVANLFQGEFPVQPLEHRGQVYPGDRFIRDDNKVTIQIHELELRHEQRVVARNVPVLAVWVPARLARDWIVQEPQR